MLNFKNEMKVKTQHKENANIDKDNVTLASLPSKVLNEIVV